MREFEYTANERAKLRNALEEVAKNKGDALFAHMAVEMSAERYVSQFRDLLMIVDTKSEERKGLQDKLQAFRLVMSRSAQNLSYTTNPVKLETVSSLAEETQETRLRAALALFDLDALTSLDVEAMAVHNWMALEVVNIETAIDALTTLEQQRSETRLSFTKDLVANWKAVGGQVKNSASGPMMRYLTAAAYPAMRAAGDFAKKGRLRAKTNKNLQPYSESSLLSMVRKIQ